MALILENHALQKGVYRLALSGAPKGCAGQFLMLRFPGVDSPFLPRPISICDEKDGITTLCYAVVGKGTGLLASMLPGQEIAAEGPYGNGFPLPDGDAALIGGGLGVAPMLYLCRALRESGPVRRISVHLGFREGAFLLDEFAALADEIVPNIGGFVTDDVDFSMERTYYACGPRPMMAAAAGLCKEHPLYVSLEARMACGVGACLGCTCETISGNRRVCKDGPVFLSTEVFYEQ